MYIYPGYKNDSLLLSIEILTCFINSITTLFLKIHDIIYSSSGWFFVCLVLSFGF